MISPCTYAVVAILVELSFDAGVVDNGVPVNVGEAKLAFKFNAVCCVVDTGLLASEVLSTFPKPTSPLTSDTAPVFDATLVTVLTSAPASIASNLVLSPFAKAPSDGGC